MSSLRDESRDLRKQIGCMNGIFQIFDRHHFLTGRSISSKRLLQGGRHQMGQQYATKSVVEKGIEVQKEKPRISTESSRASFSSSSCSSTFSSLDFNRAIQPEALPMRRVSIPESQVEKAKERQPSSTNGIRSHDLRDVVKDSMHREVRSLSIKAQNSDERRGTVMKHIDSPRPLQQSKTEKPRALARLPDERVSLPRFSYDGRESREVNKSAMKHKELPRLSLDSKTNSIKALEDSRSNFLPLNHETGSHNRTSSVVARLMGLEAFPDTISTEESRTPSIKSYTKEAEEQNKQNQVNYSLRVSQRADAASSSPKLHNANPVKKSTTFSRFSVEPAPRRQQESGQTSAKMASKSRKAAASNLRQISSVYGQIEKRITELEFKKSGKDLRALKQILEAMQKTRARMEDQRGESAELTSDSVVVVKPAKVRVSVSTAETSNQQNLQTRTPKLHRGSSAHIQKPQNLTPENRNVKNHTRHVPSIDNYANRSGAVSPRPQQYPLRIEAEQRRAKNHGSKKVTEIGSQGRKNKVKPKDQQLSDDQMSELSSDTRYSSYQGDTASAMSESNNSLVSHSETEVTSLAHSINTNTRLGKNVVSTTREHMQAVESALTMLEQPSPISVLDNAFYCEDSPSPVKKISTVFQEDESTSLDEADWCFENLNHLVDSTRLKHSFKYNQRLENMKRSVQELTQLNEERVGTAKNHNESLNPAYRYINKILLTSGLLKESFILTTDKFFSSAHLINPNMFHVLEQTEDIRDAGDGAYLQKNDKLKLNKRIQRKIIFDLVDEILVRKVTSSGLFTEGKKQPSPQRLLKEVHMEMDRLCRTSDSNLDEEDEMIRFLTEDMKCKSADWADYSGEVPAVVLDVERLIFKDLINEVITGELMDVRNWPKRHCRRLFGK